MHGETRNFLPKKFFKKIRYIHNEYLGKFYNSVPLICLSLINMSDTEGMRYWQLSFGFNGREACICLEEKVYCYVSNVGLLIEYSIDTIT